MRINSDCSRDSQEDCNDQEGHVNNNNNKDNNNLTNGGDRDGLLDQNCHGGDNRNNKNIKWELLGTYYIDDLIWKTFCNDCSSSNDDDSSLNDTPLMFLHYPLRHDASNNDDVSLESFDSSYQIDHVETHPCEGREEPPKENYSFKKNEDTSKYHKNHFYDNKQADNGHFKDNTNHIESDSNHINHKDNDIDQPIFDNGNSHNFCDIRREEGNKDNISSSKHTMLELQPKDNNKMNWAQYLFGYDNSEGDEYKNTKSTHVAA